MDNPSPRIVADTDALFYNNKIEADYSDRMVRATAAAPPRIAKVTASTYRQAIVATALRTDQMPK